MAQDGKEKHILRQKITNLEYFPHLKPQVEIDFLIFDATSYMAIQLFSEGQIHHATQKRISY